MDLKVQMGPFGMDRFTDFPGFKCHHNVDENVRHSVEEKMCDMNHFFMEPKHDNIAVDSFLGFGMENMGIGSKMEEFSHGFDFSFLPDYRGLDSCPTRDEEAGLKLEILDGYLDEVDKVEDIYASHDLSFVGDHSLPETQVNKKVSESDDGDPCGFLNFSSESFSPGISGSIGLSEWSKDIVPHANSQNVSSKRVKESLDTTSNGLYESKDDNKPTFIGSWVRQGKNRKKNLVNTSCSRLDSSDEPLSPVSYDFRPRKGPLKKYIHTTTENTLSDDDDQLTSSESEDNISVRRHTSKTRSVDRRKNQRMWTVDEVVKLVDGVSHFGVGKWTDIKNLFFHSETHRTPIDIRDKWRNLLKASYNINKQAREKRRSTTRLIPKDILHRVKELASIHQYSLSESPHDSSRSQSTSRKKKKKRSSY